MHRAGTGNPRKHKVNDRLRSQLKLKELGTEQWPDDCATTGAPGQGVVEQSPPVRHSVTLIEFLIWDIVVLDFGAHFSPCKTLERAHIAGAFGAGCTRCTGHPVLPLGSRAVCFICTFTACAHLRRRSDGTGVMRRYQRLFWEPISMADMGTPGVSLPAVPTIPCEFGWWSMMVTRLVCFTLLICASL